MRSNWFPIVFGSLVVVGICHLVEAEGAEGREGLGGVRTLAYVLQADRLLKNRGDAVEALRDCGRDLMVMDRVLKTIGESIAPRAQ